MKKRLFWLITIWMLFSLTACAMSAQGQYSEKDLNPDTGITLQAVYPVYDKSCEYISYKLANSSADTIEFGSYFRIERQVGKRWVAVRADTPVGFTDILYFAMPGTIRYETCYLNAYRSAIKPGRYRIVREINGDWYTAEFEIGDSPITAQTPHGFVPLQDVPDEYSPEQAAADGVVVLRKDGIDNSEVMSAFFSAWTQAGFRGQLRVMSETDSGWILTDLILGDTRNTSFRITLRTDDRRKEALGAVQTSYYSFFRIEDNCLWLSNYRDFETQHEKADRLLEQLIKPSVYYRGSVEMFGGIPLPQQIAELINDTRDSETTPRVTVWSPDGQISASIGNEGWLWLNTDGWGTVWSGTWGDREVLDLAWKYDDTLVIVADWSSNLYPNALLYERIYIDAEDMKSIRTLSSNQILHDFSIRGSTILE